MFRKFPVTTLKFTAIASLVLVFVLSLAWGVTYYSKSKVISVEESGLIKINANAEAYIPPGALDAYLVEEGLDRVKITVEMIDLAEDAEVGDIEPVILALEEFIVTLQNLIEENSDSKVLINQLEVVVALVQEAIDSFKSPTPDTQSAVRELNQAMSRLDVATKHGLDTAQATACKDQLEEVTGHFVFINGLLFVFSPAGAHFHPPLELTLTHTDFDEDTVLLDSDGELLEYTLDTLGNKVTIKIPHFSRYSYEKYQY